MTFLEQLFYSSNHNGLGAIIFGVLFYLAIYHAFLYLQSKKTYYLFYSFFALLNAMQLFGLLENIFFENYFNQIHFKNSPVFYNIKTISYLFFGLFIMSITNLKKENYSFYKRNLWIIYITSALIIVATISDITLSTEFSKYIFIYFLFPLFSLVTILAIPIMLKFKDDVKYYLIFGVFSYNVLNGFMYYISFQNDALLENKFMFLFYGSILIENICFALALGRKERQIFIEKNKIQKEYISQLNENEKIKQNINQQLELEIQKKAIEIREINQTILKEQKEKMEMKYSNVKYQLHLKSLQNQMNPHFIFNALNSIKSYLIENDKENGIDYLNKFSKFFRGILNNINLDEITLKEELELLKIYVKIENLRVSNSLNYSFDIDKNIDLEKLHLPPLLFQPLIENSILHGLLPSPKKNKELIVKVAQSKNGHSFIISDNGVGITNERDDKEEFKKKSYGLFLVHKRLNFYMQKNNLTYHINTDSKIGIGTTITIWMEYQSIPQNVSSKLF